MINAVISKLLAESLLSLYPVFIKKMKLPTNIQTWIRMITYVMVSLFFINYSFVTKNILTYDGMALALINLTHIYSSYEGFKKLDSGISFAIFNTYPLLILLFSGVMMDKVYIFAIIGLILFIYSNFHDVSKGIKTDQESKLFLYGFIMIIIAAITEALMFFVIRNIKTENNWNQLFISYFIGSIVMTFYILIPDSKQENKLKNTSLYTLGIAILINGIIGTIGYFLRYFSAYRLDPGTYAILSFFGIIMAYFYGVIFNNEKLTKEKIFGTLFIMFANYLYIRKVKSKY